MLETNDSNILFQLAGGKEQDQGYNRLKRLSVKIYNKQIMN